MTLPDLINGTFESLGSVAILLSCLRLLKDKQVKGVSLLTVSFFTGWGFWNLFYYPSLGQSVSGIAAGCVCAANLFWCGLILHYRSTSTTPTARPASVYEPYIKELQTNQIRKAKKNGHPTQNV